MSQTACASLADRIGFAAQLALLPIFSLYVVLCMRLHEGALVWPDLAFWAGLRAPTAETVAFYAAWIALQLALASFVPGAEIEGPPLADGGRNVYRRNGLAVLGATALIAAAVVATGVLPATFLYDELVPLALTVNIGAFALALFIYVAGRRQAGPAERERGWLEAFYLGATLNPRTGRIDWKYWMQGKPGLTLWALLAISCAAAQHARHGAVTGSMALVCVGVVTYLVDYFWHEEHILSAWDVKHEPMGWMLTWGSCAMVPLVYSAPLVYLVTVPVALSAPALAAVAALGAGGLFVFRQANTQKHEFRRDPGVRIWGRPAEFIETATGTRLLCSGWWGLARHCNYLGDWSMALAWSLATGASTPLVYVYPIFFAGLLLHRERRDNAHCARKYGADWQRYVARVPKRIIPFVY